MKDRNFFQNGISRWEHVTAESRSFKIIIFNRNENPRRANLKGPFSAVSKRNIRLVNCAQLNEIFCPYTIQEGANGLYHRQLNNTLLINPWNSTWKIDCAHCNSFSQAFSRSTMISSRLNPMTNLGLRSSNRAPSVTSERKQLRR